MSVRVKNASRPLASENPHLPGALPNPQTRKPLQKEEGARTQRPQLRIVRMVRRVAIPMIT